ncbi:MAG: TetR/AcrR family transcriptional regulator [Planctomycetota bacterium]|jgi:TetR/AcrR family transcriptional repressor of nem operon
MARPRRSHQTRERLIEEGIASLLRDGYHGTGLKALLDRVEVPKGSFYNYFESKEDFAVAAIERYAECLGQQLQESLATAPDAAAGLRAFFRSQMDEFTAAEFIGGCLVANLGSELEGNDACRAVLEKSMLGYRDGLLGALRAGQAEGSFRADLEAEAMADLLVAAWEGAVIRMKIQRSLEPLEQCLDQLLDDYFRPDGGAPKKRAKRSKTTGH